LIIAGDGPEFQRLKNLSNEHDSIIFTGYVDEETKTRLYSIADIFVLPTFHDPWGLTVNEAMTYGLPVIVTSAASCSDHLIQGNGIITTPGNVDELAQALNYLLDNEEVRKTMGAHSLHIISEYDVSAGAKPFLDAIDNIFPH
jgi:glycosyltransferase involved in cell wall biosynthesis